MTRPSQTAPLLVRGRGPRAALTLTALILALLAFSPSADASKQAVDFFGGSGTLGGQFTAATGIAVNDTGAGGVPVGTIYTADGGGNRIQRFQREDNGTPADSADDTYAFVSAWGAGVLSGGTDYEICTISTSCQSGVGAGGNATLAGDGSLSQPRGIAVDQDTGNLYVSDSGNNRVNVYDGTGAFLRSFGYDVVASGPDDAGTGYEVCIAANGDVCRAGTSGSATGQIAHGEGVAVSAPDANPATATVFLADSGNRRIGTFAPDGSAPASIGSAADFNNGFPLNVAVDSRGILYSPQGFGSTEPMQRYDTAGVDGPVGFLAPIAQGTNEKQELTVSATAGTFRLSFDPDGAGPEPPQTTIDIPFDWPANLGGVDTGPTDTVREALRELPSLHGSPNFITGANVRVDGGPGNAAGSSPYIITFEAGFGAKDVSQLTVSSGVAPLSGGSGASVTTTTQGQPGVTPFTRNLAVDPDSDGAGPDTDVLYTAQLGVIQQFGPSNAPGLFTPPTLDDDRHSTRGVLGEGPDGLAVEPSTGRLYAASNGQAGDGVYVIGDTSPTPPTAILDSIDNLSAISADLHATIDPNGPPATRYHFEYVTDASCEADVNSQGPGHCFDHAASTPEVILGAQETQQAISQHLQPPPLGLEPNVLYHVRLVAGRRFGTPIITPELTFTTAGAPPLVETVGAPVRTSTTAQLGGRVTPLGSATTYHFEYGAAGPCASNPCASTPAMAAGSGQLTELVAEEVTELAPDTTYHYRLIADNGVGAPVPGADLTVHTRASDQFPGQSDTFPGPPGSDRAWELVSIGDSGGNPVFFAHGFSSDGTRAVFGVAGGTSLATAGAFQSIYLSERPPGAHPESGWQTRLVTPPRTATPFQNWTLAFGRDDLASFISENKPEALIGTGAVWRLHPDAAPEELFTPEPPLEQATPFLTGISADGTRVVAALSGGTIDPAYPAAGLQSNFYDISAQPPRLVSLLPNESPAACGLPGVSVSGGAFSELFRKNASHWISADGSLVYFPSQGAGPCAANEKGGAPTQLYVRDLDAGQTDLVSGPPLSGPSCPAGFLAGVPGAAFFATSTRLDPDDSVPQGCGDSNDVYRYDTADGSLDCLTCLYPGFDTEVEGSAPISVAVSDDGSRLYFTTHEHLLPGAPPPGTRATYRLLVGSGNLAFVTSASVGARNIGSFNPGDALTPDGSRLVFAADSPTLNPLGATTDNGGLEQYYRYDDSDRSLVCVSCPADGSPPLAAVDTRLVDADEGQAEPNLTPLSADGGTFAFSSATPLLGADQNTPPAVQNVFRGDDVYEWRDGRLLLITDGLTDWPLRPKVEGVSPSGSDVLFAATASYTADAIDASRRLYDARIDGGIDFPPAIPPCPLEVCQGTPNGAPAEQPPGTSDFRGPGNPEPETKPCPKGKHRLHGKCVSKHKKHRKHKHRRAANHNRRTSR